MIVFGQTQPAQTGNLFGGGTAFGQTQQNAQQQPQQNAFGGSLFGAKPAGTAGTSIFGSAPAATTTQPTGNLFGAAAGQNNATQASTTNAFGTGGSLFGNKPATGTFGATQSAAPAGGSLFGGNQSILNVSALGSGQQPSLTASIAQPIGANLPIFDLLGPGPKSVVLDPPKKKSSLFADIPHRQPIPRLQLGYTPQQSRLRGFNASTAVPASVTFSSSKPGALAISASTAPVGTEAFFNGNASTTSLGTAGRQSVKKLVLDRDVTAADVFASLERPVPGALKAGANKAKPAFSAALGIAAREKEAAGALTAPTPPPPAPAPAPAPTEKAAPTPGEPQEDEYYVVPSLDELKKLGYDQLSSVRDLVVGRVGHGEIHFLEPVNLTEVPRLHDLLGGLIQFGDKDCCIYPDYDEANKPPAGQGLNVRAKIRIEGAWPLDKATKEPIKDENSRAMAKHEKRLRSIKGTKFESFDKKTGDWTFVVDSF
jgi:nuclear pore complex protein Nup98-Nup96